MMPIITAMPRTGRLVAGLAVLLGAAGAFADPLPEGTAAPSAPDARTAPDKAQPPPVMEQQDVPPVAPPVAEKGEPAQPEAGKPAADAGAAVPKPEEEPKNVEPVAPSQAFAVLGKKVHGPDGKDILGSIIDVLVDDQGHPRAAIVDFGGFLGVGSRKIAVDWQLMKFRPADPAASIVLDLDRSQIQAAPEYKDPTQPAKVVEPAVANTPAATPPAEGQAPADAPPPAPQPSPPGSVAAPAPPPDAAAQPDADKHAN